MGGTLAFDFVVVEWLVAFMVSSSAFLGAVWGARKFGLLKDPGLSEVLWRGAIVLSFVASLPSVAQFGSVVELNSLTSSAVQSATPRLVDDSAVSLVRQQPTLTGSVAPAELRQAPGVLAETPVVQPAEKPAGQIAGGNSFIHAVWGYAQANSLRVLLGAWLLVSAIFVMGIFRSYWRSIRAFGPRHPVADDHRLARQLGSMCDHAGVLKAPRLTVSRHIISPVSLPGYEICMPRWAIDELDDRKLGSMLAHELGHLQRGDHLLFPALHLLARCFIFQPLLAVAIRDLQSLAEIAADEWAANNTKDAKSMAHTLYACAEKLSLQPKPTWGITMANEKSALKMRIERLIELQKLSVKRVGLAPKVLALVAMFGAALMMPQFQFAEAVADGTDNPSVMIQKRDEGRSKIHITDDNYELEAEWIGEFEWNADETDIVSMAEGASLQIETEIDGLEQRIRIQVKDGLIDHKYRFDGESHVFDKDAQVWFAAALKTLFRSSGWEAERRVARMLANGGPQSVLDEMDQLPSDYVARIYLGHLVKQADLDAAQLGRLVTRASAFDSDYELRLAINQIFEYEDVTQDILPLMLEAVKGVDSDYELRLVVEQAVASEMLTIETVRELLKIAGDNVDSDYELRQIVTITADKLAGDDDAIKTAVALIGEMDSDYERRLVVGEIAPHVGTNEDLWLDVLNQISGIDSDYEKRIALTTVHALMPKTDALVAAYHEAAMAIAGDYERQQALLGGDKEASADMTQAERTWLMTVPSVASVPSVPSVASVPSVPSVASIEEMQEFEAEHVLLSEDVRRHAGEERQHLEAERQALLARQAHLQARAEVIEARIQALEAARADQTEKKD